MMIGIKPSFFVVIYFMAKIKPKIRKVTLPDGKVITVIEAPTRKYRPLPPNLPKYAPPRLAAVRSETPFARISSISKIIKIVSFRTK